MIEVTALRIDYGAVCAVSNVTFAVAPGEVLGLIGPNGAGKTSLMRALVGLVRPTLGAIRIGGVEVSAKSREAQRRTGFMPDFPPLEGELTAREFLDLFAAAYYVPKPERPARIAAALETVGLTAKTDSLTAQLSRGMRQRLMLAKTLLPRPAAVVLDEPASGLDPHARATLRTIVLAEAARGAAVLLSSHVLPELGEMCDRVGIMERGRLKFSGTLEALAQHVAHRERYRLGVLGDAAAAERCLATLPQVATRTRIGERGFDLTLNGREDAASAVIAALVGAGVGVTELTPDKASLEELFLQVGAEEVT